MGSVDEPDRTPWHVRAVQVFLAGCAALGLRAYQKSGTVKPPPPTAPATVGVARYLPAAADVGHAYWATGGGVARAGDLPLGSQAPTPSLLPVLRTPAAGPAVPLQAAARVPRPRLPQEVAQAERPAKQARADAVPATPLQVTTAANVDERLFLLRALDALYERWPIGIEEPAGLQAALGAIRHEALRHRQYVADRGLDDRIAALYGDLVDLVDVYSEALAESGRIEREGVARAERERAEGVAKSSFSGGMQAGRALGDGASGGEALAAWAGVTLLGSALDELAKAPARDEDRRRALEANARGFEAKYSAAYARLQSAALALSDRYNWAKGEAGFDLSQEQASDLLERARREGPSGLMRLAKVARSRRPRDPFVLASGATLRALSFGKAATPEQLAACSDECFVAASLVPEGAFYDAYRAECIALAGLFATAAARAELGDRGWGAAPVPRANRAERVWRTYLVLDPHDVSGEAREQLAWTLACAGKLGEASAAAAQVADLRGGDYNFAYNYACLLSVTGSSKDALRWLEHAVKACGHPDIAWIRADPDLARVRSEQATGFRDLTEARFEWSIDWGTISHDDIVVVNRSPFALTNVTLDVTVTSKGSAPWVRALTVDRIEAGATCRLRTWVTARGGDATGKAVLRCDQNR